MDSFGLTEKLVVGSVILIIILAAVSSYRSIANGEDPCELYRYYPVQDVPVSCLKYFNVQPANTVIVK